MFSTIPKSSLDEYPIEAKASLDDNKHGKGKPILYFHL